MGSDTAFFTFGRFQPPTIGHGMLIKEIGRLAASAAADAYIFVSSTVDKKNNPLSVKQKVKYLKKMLPDSYAEIVNTTEIGYTTPVTVAKMLYDMGYKEIIMIIGSDRVADFTKIFKKSHPYISVKQAGNDRKTMSRLSIKSISGSLMRKAATEGNVRLFKKGTKTGLMTDEDVMTLMNEVRHGMDLPPFARRIGSLRALAKGANNRHTLKL